MSEFLTAMVSQSPTLAFVGYMLWLWRDDKKVLLEICIKNAEVINGMKGAIDKLTDRLTYNQK